ncbi:hypothetical protein [Actinomadura rudentiformis]|uniref:Uncharacterized protein n=1 Tax=Actinomadura rudentiformis TaxID=359158 RepID=A0A6H9YQD9_9ACTN|nr:hypothetical protein [Actinomadura rudentiformis]KAB2347358.1 hypothetical protein F8566_20310 [Actinomadura rudentiformis]
MPGHAWRYAIYDLLTRRQLIEHMPFEIESFTTMLGEAGTLQATLPLGDPAIRARKPRELLLTRRTNLIIFRDEVPVWDGVIWHRRPRREGSKSSATFQASEIRSVLERRLFRPLLGYGSAKTLSYTQADMFTVFRDLLADAQNFTYLDLRPGDLGIEADASQMSGVLIDRRDAGSELGAFHGYTFTTYGQLLRDLVEGDPGMEWRIHTWIDEGRALRRRVLLGSPQLGGDPNASPLPTYEYPGQIYSYEWPDDGEQSANYVAALGEGEGDNLRWAESSLDDELLAGYPLLETVTSHKSDSSLVILQGRAAADLAAVSGDRTVPSLDIVGYPQINPGAYIRVRIADENWFPGSSAVPFEAVVRVVGLRIQPGGRERTSLIIEEPRSPA